MGTRRRWWITAALLATAMIAADHLRPRDDWAGYNHRAATVAAVPAGDALQLDDGTRVHLLGICDPAPAATDWLTARLAGRRVTLLLPPVGTRDAAGRLRAYAFDGAGCLNVELVKAGLAYADRRGPDLLAGLTDPAEADARRHGRGLWAGLTFGQQPPWRQAWLRARGKPSARP